MRIIKVPENTIPVRDESQDPPVRTEENYFWFTLEKLLEHLFRSLSNIDARKHVDLYDEIIGQKGNPDLKIQREGDYETLKSWVDNNKGWAGKPRDIAGFGQAFQDAEKVKAPQPEA